MGFAVLLALFLRDVVRCGQVCTMDTKHWEPGIALWKFCAAREQAAAGRLWYEAVGLVLAGGLLGAALGRWRKLLTKPPCCTP